METTATVAGCPRCGVAEPHGRRPVTVRDLPRIVDLARGWSPRLLEVVRAGGDWGGRWLG